MNLFSYIFFIRERRAGCCHRSHAIATQAEPLIQRNLPGLIPWLSERVHGFTNAFVILIAQNFNFLSKTGDEGGASCH